MTGSKRAKHDIQKLEHDFTKEVSHDVKRGRFSRNKLVMLLAGLISLSALHGQNAMELRSTLHRLETKNTVELTETDRHAIYDGLHKIDSLEKRALHHNDYLDAIKTVNQYIQTCDSLGLSILAHKAHQIRKNLTHGNGFYGLWSHIAKRDLQQGVYTYHNRFAVFCKIPAGEVGAGADATAIAKAANRHAREQVSGALSQKEHLDANAIMNLMKGFKEQGHLVDYAFDGTYYQVIVLFNTSMSDVGMHAPNYYVLHGI
ncbi:hypothetical protein K9M74_04060 [Candidatus Woesearchaeota archaeon]|nr:hypothetical protein [Candidatus Woesearchaeota archaeon]